MDQRVRDFHTLYYGEKEQTWKNTQWMGIPVAKCPLDLWIYQEIIYKTQPDVIIETGTYCGGSACYFAHMMDLINHGRRVITIDIHPGAHLSVGLINHPKIIGLNGDSISNAMIDQLKYLIHHTDKVMVILDSDHSKAHVLKELELYAPFVSPGQYLIVEDTNVNGNPVYENHGPGPMEAIDEWMRIPGTSIMFEMDHSCEKFFMTFNPRGYFKRRGGV